jgi:hypothetical protein
MKRVFFLMSVLFSVSLLAQDEAAELVTDRPDQTESSSVVPHKSLQIETGFIWENDESDLYKQKTFVYNSTLLRYGLLERMELRLGLAYLSEEIKIKDTDTVNTISGFSPMYAGFKIYILEENGWIPEIAFLGGLVIPVTAHKDFKAPYSAPTMRFAFSHTLSDRFSLGYNLGAEWYGETAIPEYFYSLALGIAITDKFGTYLEVFGFLPEEGKASHLLDGGFTYLVLPNLQLDISGGLGLNEEAIDNYWSLGLSYRLPK